MKEQYMREAIKEALKGKRIDEVPVGCVIVKDGKVIATGYNKKESTLLINNTVNLINA